MAVGVAKVRKLKLTIRCPEQAPRTPSPVASGPARKFPAECADKPALTNAAETMFAIIPDGAAFVLRSNIPAPIVAGQQVACSDYAWNVRLAGD